MKADHGWVIDALERVHRRLVVAGAVDELRALSRMSDAELLVLAEREAQEFSTESPLVFPRVVPLAPHKAVVVPYQRTAVGFKRSVNR